MARRIPSLTQLRAFEAAARHMSFKDAAKELCVTQAAVSHQIKALEEELGVKLFRRGVRQVTLTSEAESFARTLTNAFDAIASAAAAFGDEDLAGPLRLSVAPFYGNRWLLPRLSGFRAQYPEVDLQIDVSFDMVDLANSDFDAAVRYGNGDWPDLECIQIHPDVVGPVCAPQYVAGRSLPLSPREIRRLSLATSTDLSSDWADWLSAVGETDLGGLDLVQYANAVYSFDAALSGHAVCLADIRSTAADEAAGNLVRLHPLTIERAKGIYLVFPKSAAGRRRRAEVFAAWMKHEAEEALGEPTPVRFAAADSSG